MSKAMNEKQKIICSNKGQQLNYCIIIIMILYNYVYNYQKHGLSCKKNISFRHFNMVNKKTKEIFGERQLHSKVKGRRKNNL